MTRYSIVSSFVIGLALMVDAPTRAAPAAPEPIAAYRTYASAQAEILVRMTRMLAKDIRDGDVQASQNDYAATHRYLERIRPMLALQGDLATRMDAGADAYPDREHDAGFSGFHRIEHGLFALNSTQDLAPVADHLYEDTLRLRAAVATQPVRPDLLVDLPTALIAQSVRDGSREPYAHTDLWDIEADVDGAHAMVDAVRPQVQARDPLAMQRIDAAFAATGERMTQMRDGCGFKAYDRLTAAERTGLRETTLALARELARLRVMPAID